MISHPKPREIKRHIDPASRDKSHWKAWGLFSLVYWAYLASLVAAIVIPWWAKPLMILVNGVSIAVLFIVGHDACHRCYSPSRMADGAIGRLSFLPSLWSFATWRVAHNYFHHGFTNVKGMDHAWQPMAPDDYQRASWQTRLFQRHSRTWLGIASHWIGRVWCECGVIPRPNAWQILLKRKGEYIWETILLCIFAILKTSFIIALSKGEFSSLGVLAPVLAIFIYWGIPFWIYSFFAGLVTLVQHTHPTTVWFADRKEWSFFGSQIEGTVHFKFPFPINKILLDVMEHNAHHVDTMIPLYNLIGQQKNLEQAYPDNIVVEEFSVANISRLLNTCQLYDFKEHRWLNFQGRPTTPATPLKRAASASQ